MHLAFINTIYNIPPPLITPQPTQPVYQLPLQVTSTWFNASTAAYLLVNSTIAFSNFALLLANILSSKMC